VIACKKERMAVHSMRREAQQQMKCWGCGERGKRGKLTAMSKKENEQ